jgi:hypothetical protein
MEVIDEDGNLLGWVNAVDALAVLLVGLIVVFGGATLIFGSGPTASDPTSVTTQVVELRSTGHAADIGSLVPEGPSRTAGVVAVENRTVVSADGNYTLLASLRLRVNTSESGVITFEGERLYIGKDLSLDLGATTLTGTVTGASAPEETRSVPTPTPTQTPTDTTTTAPTTEPGPPETGLTESTRTITVTATLEEDAADAISEGPVESDDIVSVQRKSTTTVDDGVRVTLEVEVDILTADDGTVYFRGVELTEGRSLVLQLDGLTVRSSLESL